MVGGVYEAAYAGPAPVTIDSTADTGEGLDWGGSGRARAWSGFKGNRPAVQIEADQPAGLVEFLVLYKNLKKSPWPKLGARFMRISRRAYVTTPNL